MFKKSSGFRTLRSDVLTFSNNALIHLRVVYKYLYPYYPRDLSSMNNGAYVWPHSNTQTYIETETNAHTCFPPQYINMYIYIVFTDFKHIFTKPFLSKHVYCKIIPQHKMTLQTVRHCSYIGLLIVRKLNLCILIMYIYIYIYIYIIKLWSKNIFPNIFCVLSIHQYHNICQL